MDIKLSTVWVPCQYLLAKGDRIGWVLFAEYRTARICALLPSLLDGCCSVSLLDSALLPLNSTYSRAKFTPPTSKHSWSCLASTCHWYLPSFFSLFFRNPLFDKQVRQMMSSTQVATLLSSRTTTSLRSRIVPKAAACGLLVMEPAWLSSGLLVHLDLVCNQTICYLYVWCTVGRCFPIACHLDLAQ